jgi:hypothetical protein
MAKVRERADWLPIVETACRRPYGTFREAEGDVRPGDAIADHDGANEVGQLRNRPSVSASSINRSGNRWKNMNPRSGRPFCDHRGRAILSAFIQPMARDHFREHQNNLQHESRFGRVGASDEVTSVSWLNHNKVSQRRIDLNSYR